MKGRLVVSFEQAFARYGAEFETAFIRLLDDLEESDAKTSKLFFGAELAGAALPALASRGRSVLQLLNLAKEVNSSSLAVIS